jgi:hypothetical protein
MKKVQTFINFINESEIKYFINKTNDKYLLDDYTGDKLGVKEISFLVTLFDKIDNNKIYVIDNQMREKEAFSLYKKIYNKFTPNDVKEGPDGYIFNIDTNLNIIRYENNKIGLIVYYFTENSNF